MHAAQLAVGSIHICISVIASRTSSCIHKSSRLQVEFWAWEARSIYWTYALKDGWRKKIQWQKRNPCRPAEKLLMHKKAALTVFLSSDLSFSISFLHTICFWHFFSPHFICICFCLFSNLFYIFIIYCLVLSFFFTFFLRICFYSWFLTSKFILFSLFYFFLYANLFFFTFFFRHFS